MKSKIVLTLATIALSISAMASKIETRWGACCHVVRGYEYPYHQKMFEGMKEMNLRAIRTDMDWILIDKNDGISFEKYDEVFGRAFDKNINVLGIITGTRTSKESAVNVPERWKKYVEATVSHFKGRIEDWEIVNEVDWGHWLNKHKDNPKAHADEYTKILKDGYTLIKKTNPNARVLFSGVAFMNSAFLDEVFKNDVANYFDVMNVHNYYGLDNPEFILENNLKKLKANMAKNNINKPIWLTETGSNSAPIQKSIVQGVRESLSKLNITPDEVVEIYDEAENYSTRMFTDFVADIFPEKKKLKKIKLTDIEKLDIAKQKAILLQCNAIFPRKYLPALHDYVARGGTIISLGDIPLAHDCFINEDGTAGRKSYGNESVKLFHMIASTPWNRDLPKTENFVSKNLVAGPEFKTVEAKGVYQAYFIVPQLKGNDKLYPILSYKHEGKEYALGALIKYDSELKGNAIVFMPSINSGGSEEYYGTLLPRYMISALAYGVDKVFNYSYHSNGLFVDAEGHFGITRLDCSYKAPWYAYKTVIEMLGEKGKPEMKIENGIVTASWTRDDGKKVHAIWKLLQVKKIKIKFTPTGEITEMKNWLGKDLKIPRAKSFKRNIFPAPIYIVGPEKIDFKIVK